MKAITNTTAAVSAFWLLTACSGEPTDPAEANLTMEESVSVIDGALPEGEAESSQPSREELRERAKTDPEGADAAAIDNMSRNEVIATAINSAGFLCARVTDAYPSGGAIIVNCVENRSGSGRVKYRVDANAGSVEQLD